MQKLFLSFYVWLYRVSGGRIGGSMGGFNVLLLHTTGRKSGQAHTTPVGYFEHEGGYVIVASNAGKDQNPGWYYNLKNMPQVEIEIGSQHLQAKVQMIDSASRPAIWKKIVAAAPNYGAYETKTKREIPLVLLKPV
jgi:deazaflavin-dependent oxidoreductase (nitroreductase family)